ncbi:hypothetical protein Tco_0074428 [Tanacetum coccineum]
MAAYQRMIAEMDPTQREEALTETGQKSMPVPKTALTLIATRVAFALAAAAMTHAPSTQEENKLGSNSS